jgi:sec-independent protein translocase protein TatA
MLANFGPTHWAILAVAGVLLFGGFKKLPDAARSLGKSMRIFKSEMHEMHNDGKPDTTATPAPAPTPITSERVDMAAAPPPEQATDVRPA